MKKQWIVLPLVLCFASVSYTQEAMAGQNQGVAAAEKLGEPATNLQGFVSTVGYTYVKGDVTYASPMALFEIKGADAQSGLDKIFVSVDSGEFAPYKGAISFAEEGPHSLAYRFIDKVGNISESKLFSIYVDATPTRVLEPVFTPALYIASGKNYIGLKNQISFKYYDDLTGVAFIDCSVDTNALVRYDQPFSPENLGLTNSAPFVLNYKATDMVSNVTALKKYNLYLDATAPTVNVFAKVYEVNGIKYISPKDIIQVEAVDAETKVESIMFAINEGAYTNYDPAIGIHITTPGEYDIKAKATDVVGNTSAEVIFSIVVDGLAPKGDAAYAGMQDAEAPVTNNFNEFYGSGVGAAPVTGLTNTPVAGEGAVAPLITNAAPVNQAGGAKGEASQEVPAGTQAPAAKAPAQAK